MSTSRKNRNPSPAGQRLENAIYKRFGDSYDSVAKFERKLTKELNGPGFDTVQTTISAMINGLDSNEWNRKYFLPIERILDVRIADIIDGSRVFKPSPRGLYEIGTQGKYEDFQWLSEQTDGSVEVIKSYDEWSKSIFDYVYESKNIEGLRFLVDHGYYEVFGPGRIMAYSYHAGSDEEHSLILLDLLSQDEDPEAKMFVKLFDGHEHSDLADINSGVLWNDNVLEAIIKSERLLKAVCRKPDILPESAINDVRRTIFEGEYKAICASNWLTPLLCYALNHEDQYREQAIQLLDASLEVASATLSNIGKNKGLLGGSDDSITTKKGRVILGHRYVIGIIGEPMTEGEIKDPVLKKKAAELTSKIGSFRAMAKYQTPVLVDGKMHLPPVDQNPLYRKFVDIAKGRRFLLQKADSKDGDGSNYVFEAPKGKEAHGLSLDQWFQIGQALKTIHQIDTGIEGKVFCHGRFYYADFYVLDDGDLECISGYRDVHIGDYEEDLFSAGFLAFNNNYVRPDAEQEAIESLLEGYGYPKEGFLEKLWNYLILQAKAEANANEMRFLMDCATGVLRAMKAK